MNYQNAGAECVPATTNTEQVLQRSVTQMQEMSHLIDRLTLRIEIALRPEEPVKPGPQNVCVETIPLPPILAALDQSQDEMDRLMSRFARLIDRIGL